MKKKLAFSVFILSLLILSGCKTNQGIAESKAEDFAELNYPLQISFEVEDTSLRNDVTVNMGCVDDIKGYGYYFNIDEDVVSAVLPCFRASTITNGFKSTQLTIDSQIFDNLTYQRHQDPREFTLRFEVQDRSDRWNFELHIRPDKTAYLNVFSGNLPRAGYTGKVREHIVDSISGR